MTPARFTKGFLAQTIATALTGIATLLVQLVLARQLGPSTFAVFGVATSIAAVAFILQDGGFRVLLYREATHPTVGFPEHGEILSRALGWNLVTSTVLVGAALGGLTLYSALLAVTVALLVATNFGRIISSDLSALMRARSLFVAEARWQILNRILVGASIVVAVTLTDNLIVALAAGAIAQVGILFLHLPRRMLRNSSPGFDFHLLRACLILVAIDLGTALYFRSDVLLLAAYGRPAEEIGIYAAMMRIVDAYIFGLTPLATLFFRYSRLAAMGGRPAYGLGLLIVIVEIFTLIILVVAGKYHDAIVDGLFGTSYRAGAAYLPWLIAACCAAGPNALLGQALLANNREGSLLAAVGATLIVNFCMNVSLVPNSGAEGAAKATFATELALTLCLCIALLRPSRSTKAPISTSDG